MLHERENIVMAAEQELRQATMLLNTKYDLTAGEVLRVVSSVFGDTVSSMAKYMIREERHGNEDIPGGLASDADRREGGA